MSQDSAASGPLEEPAGMEAEAQLLTSLQEIPNISKCWLRPAHADGLSLTVWSPCCCPLSLLAHTRSANSEPAAVLAHMFFHSLSHVSCVLQTSCSSCTYQHHTAPGACRFNLVSATCPAIVKESMCRQCTFPKALLEITS